MDDIEERATGSLQRRYNIHRRNIQILQERIATFAGDAPLDLHNRLAYEQRQLAPLRDLLSDSSLDLELLDAFDTTEQNGLILARLRRVEQRQQNREAQAEEDWQQRQQRQAQQDTFFWHMRLIGYGLIVLFLIAIGLLIALLARG